MKKHLIAAAALATLSSAAFAQSATVYGIIDQSIWKNNNASSTGQSLTSMESGAWLPSLFGVTGTEDLGGGMKAKFVLEGNLQSDTGAMTTGGFFDRQSWVGLSGGFGELRAGKQIDALFLQSFVNNVRLSHSNSAAVIGALVASGGSNTGQSAGLLTGTVFSPNTVTYITPAMSGFKLTAQHQMGETAGSTSANSATAFLANFDGIQNLSLSAGTKNTKNGSASDSGNYMTQNLLGAVYKMGAFQFNAQTNTYKWKKTVASSGDFDGVEAGDKQTLNEFGVAYAVNPKVTVALNYVDWEFKATDGKASTDITSLSAKYAFSKRTSVWVMGSRTDKVKLASGQPADFTLPAAPYYLAPSGSGDKATTGYGVGLTHTF
jgi:predicted porin